MQTPYAPAAEDSVTAIHDQPSARPPACVFGCDPYLTLPTSHLYPSFIFHLTQSTCTTFTRRPQPVCSIRLSCPPVPQRPQAVSRHPFPPLPPLRGVQVVRTRGSTRVARITGVVYPTRQSLCPSYSMVVVNKRLCVSCPCTPSFSTARCLVAPSQECVD